MVRKKAAAIRARLKVSMMAIDSVVRCKPDCTEQAKAPDCFLVRTIDEREEPCGGGDFLRGGKS
jgi:hypothetical protein